VTLTSQPTQHSALSSQHSYRAPYDLTEEQGAVPPDGARVRRARDRARGTRLDEKEEFRARLDQRWPTGSAWAARAPGIRPARASPLTTPLHRRDLVGGCVALGRDVGQQTRWCATQLFGSARASSKRRFFAGPCQRVRRGRTCLSESTSGSDASNMSTMAGGTAIATSWITKSLGLTRWWRGPAVSRGTP